MSGGGMGAGPIKATDQNAYGTANVPFGQGPGYGINNYGGAATYPAAGSTQYPTQTLNQMSDTLRGNPNAPMVSQPPPQSTADTISGYYKNILQRDPDQAGYDYWNKRAGEGMDMNAIKQSFLNSNEYMNSPANQQAYSKYLANQQQPQQFQVQQPMYVPQAQYEAYSPTVSTWSAPQQQQAFINPTAVTQSGADGGGAMNYQYRRGGIAALVR